MEQKMVQSPRGGSGDSQPGQDLLGSFAGHNRSADTIAAAQRQLTQSSSSMIGRPRVASHGSFVKQATAAERLAKPKHKPEVIAEKADDYDIFGHDDDDTPPEKTSALVQKTRHLLETLQDAFNSADVDGDGELTRCGPFSLPSSPLRHKSPVLILADLACCNALAHVRTSLVRVGRSSRRSGRRSSGTSTT